MNGIENDRSQCWVASAGGVAGWRRPAALQPGRGGGLRRIGPNGTRDADDRHQQPDPCPSGISRQPARIPRPRNQQRGGRLPDRLEPWPPR
jgi:hypothetical protein